MLKPVTDKRWRLRAPQPAAAAEIAAAGVDPLLAAILAARGCKSAVEAEPYTAPSLAMLEDPFRLQGMEGAVQRILLARERCEKVCIHGDYDVDGVTATALLVRFLRVAGVPVCWVIPRRLEDGYGLSTEGVDEALALGASVMVTVDCGITSVAEARYCRERKIDLIITDHHTPGEALPDAVSIINPLQNGCSSVFKALAGVGLALKLAMAIRSRMRILGLFAGAEEPNLAEYLDLAALGTIADLVPLVGENRIIAAFGLGQLSRSTKPGIAALRKVSGVHGTVSAGDVGFKLAPRINAAGRLDDAKRGLELLLTDDEATADALAEELDAANRERQQIEKEILAEALQMIASNPAMAGRKSIVLASDRWHPGIIGIVASRLVEIYALPVILIAIYEGKARGSGRSIGSFHLYQALKACSGHLSGFGGHKQAAGLQIDVEKIAAFADGFDTFAAENLQNDDMLPELAIDLQLQTDEVNFELCALKNSLQPFGMGNPEPVFMLAGVQLLEQRVLDGGHLKLRLQSGSRTFDAIGFRMAEGSPRAGRVDVAFNLDINVWQGRQRLQLKLKGIRAAGGLFGAE